MDQFRLRIRRKILKDKGFVGRVSLQMKLEEMPLSDANKFSLGNENVSSAEKFKLLCVTGGIPDTWRKLILIYQARPTSKECAINQKVCYSTKSDMIFHRRFWQE